MHLLRRPRFLPALAAVLVLALAAAGCGGDDDGGAETTAGVAEGPTVSGAELRRCLEQAGLTTGPAAADALLADYAAEAEDSFVIEDPIAQVLVFDGPVDLERAEQRLRRASTRGGGRATGLQGDALGNVLVAYFVQGGADKTEVNGCLEGTPEPVPGFAAPSQPSGLAPGAATS